MSAEDDYMEIGESGLVSSGKGGFIEKATGKYVSYDELIYEDEEEWEDEEYDRDADDPAY